VVFVRSTGAFNCLIGSEYSVVSIPPVKPSVLTTRSVHEQKQKEYLEASKTLRHNACDHITQLSDQG